MRTEVIKTYHIWDNKDEYIGYTTDFNTYNYFSKLLQYEPDITKNIKYIYEYNKGNKNNTDKIKEYLKNTSEKFNAKNISIYTLGFSKSCEITIVAEEFDKNTLTTKIILELNIKL